MRCLHHDTIVREFYKRKGKGDVRIKRYDNNYMDTWIHIGCSSLRASGLRTLLSTHVHMRPCGYSSRWFFFTHEKDPSPHKGGPGDGERWRPHSTSSRFYPAHYRPASSAYCRCQETGLPFPVTVDRYVDSRCHRRTTYNALSSRYAPVNPLSLAPVLQYNTWETRLIN